MSEHPLSGCRVLVPRGGEFGGRLAARVRELGGTAVIAPLIDFAPPADAAPLHEGVQRLAEGHYDWLVVTSATTVDALGAPLTLAAGTRVAAVGPATAAALRQRGISVDLMADPDHSAVGLLAAWQDTEGRVFLPQSEIAAETLSTGLAERGLTVDVVTAYRTVPVTLDPVVRDQIRTGSVHAVLLTSGSTARELAAQCAPVPDSVSIVCIGDSTAIAAARAGLRVAAVATRSEGESLIEALVGLRA